MFFTGDNKPFNYYNTSKAIVKVKYFSLVNLHFQFQSMCRSGSNLILDKCSRGILLLDYINVNNEQ